MVSRTIGLTLFAALLISLTGQASAARISVRSTDVGAVGVYVQMEEDASVAAVDVGIRLDGAVVTGISSASNDDANCDSAFCGAFLGPSNSSKNEGTVAFLTGSSLGSGIGPFTSGEEFLLGTILFEPVSQVLFSFDDGTLYKISDGASQAIQDDGQLQEDATQMGVGSLLYVPEPSGLALIGLVIASLALRARRG